MREIVYIAPSGIIQLEFIRRLREKLEENNIAVDEINMPRMMIRVGDTIICAVSVLGSNAFRGYNFVRFYIDGISECGKSGIHVNADARDISEQLKRTFPQDAKEISEGGLIGILKEG